MLTILKKELQSIEKKRRKGCYLSVSFETLRNNTPGYTLVYTYLYSGIHVVVYLTGRTSTKELRQVKYGLFRSPLGYPTSAYISIVNKKDASSVKSPKYSYTDIYKFLTEVQLCAELRNLDFEKSKWRLRENLKTMPIRV